jgi:hypothetical protein
MKRTKEIGEKLIKYAEEHFPESSKKTKQLRKYVKDIREVSGELIFSSSLMASHKNLFVDPSPEV